MSLTWKDGLTPVCLGVAAVLYLLWVALIQGHAAGWVKVSCT